MYEIAQRIREVFLENRAEIDLPFFHRFPVNSCESASYFLGALLAKFLSDKEVFVVHGYKHSSDESHFWVEVDGKVIDITVDQFTEFSEPIYGAEVHPLSAKFKPDSKVEAIKGINQFDLVSQEKKKEVLNQILHLLQART
ncbi:hypothetical protein [Vibrio cholerae]|uniref:hypothetical protein n=1 Tax=Vibrio cholerae TaxID=666 RepID=UPI0011580E1B|nr:hypothetical protein [Vibrio cholerae]TQQ47732.1 hypothetical protein FLL62_16475 [Vibrio cholerae]